MKLTFKTLVGPLCITLALWGLTGVYWQNVEQETAAKRALALGHAADNAQALLRQRLLRFELVLRGAKGFYEGSEFVTRAEFKRYIQTLQLDATKVGLQGIAIALRVDHADKQLHTAEMQRRGFSPYQVKPEGVRAQYTPIVLIEPLDAINERALGFDIATNPVAHQALDQSLLTGKEVITGQLALAQDAGQNRPAVVMYLPLLAEGSNAVVGWVSGPFRIQDLLDAIAPLLRQRATPQAGLFTRLAEREAAQPAWRWACEQCDAPECEHQLRQLQRPPAGAA